MRPLSQTECKAITGAGEGEGCKAATLEMLNICSASQRAKINNVLKAIALSEEMKDADPQAIKAAMIAAIQDAEF